MFAILGSTAMVIRFDLAPRWSFRTIYLLENLIKSLIHKMSRVYSCHECLEASSKGRHIIFTTGVLQSFLLILLGMIKAIFTVSSEQELGQNL